MWERLEELERQLGIVPTAHVPSDGESTPESFAELTRRLGLHADGDAEVSEDLFLQHRASVIDSPAYPSREVKPKASSRRTWNVDVHGIDARDARIVVDYADGLPMDRIVVRAQLRRPEEAVRSLVGCLTAVEIPILESSDSRLAAAFASTDSAVAADWFDLAGDIPGMATPLDVEPWVLAWSLIIADQHRERLPENAVRQLRGRAITPTE